MRANHAKECAKDAMVQCPLMYSKDGNDGCSHYELMDGSKAQIMARLKEHIRKCHSEQDYKDWLEAKQDAI